MLLRELATARLGIPEGRLEQRATLLRDRNVRLIRRRAQWTDSCQTSSMPFGCSTPQALLIGWCARPAVSGLLWDADYRSGSSY